MITPQALQILLGNHQVIPIKFAGHSMLLDAGGVLVWPQQDLLVFSDLHLEKGSFLSQFANPLPRFDSKDTIKRMSLLMQRYDCQHVVCLGDSLHDANALKRMLQDDLTRLNTLVKSVSKWTWVLGNHDPNIPLEVLGERAPYLLLQNVLLVHEPENLEVEIIPGEALLPQKQALAWQAANAQIIGHYHPKSSHKLANRKVTGKSFVCDESIVLMPAFGKYTGGLDIDDEAFADVFSRKRAQVYLSYLQKIYLL
jgi:metallophosphoesterase superfamily enzyme